MQELRTNLHTHTTFSDGSKLHLEVIKIAAASGIQALIFTDHNIYLKGIEKYYDIDGKMILVIMGEEIHDPNAIPQKNHLLALGADKELSVFANDRNRLISEIHNHRGAAFLAHPYDPALPDFHEPDISWEDWSVEGFDGLELWNGFSELKVRAERKLDPYLYAFFPKFLPESPPQKTIDIWDRLHKEGKKVSGVAGSDAHAIPYSAGPFHRSIFPYSYHFSAINNYVLLPDGLEGNFDRDKKIVISALARGHNFLANDLIRNPVGFRFYIKDEYNNRYEMGDTGKYSDGLKIHLKIPSVTEVHIIRDGKRISQSQRVGEIVLPIESSGVYRIECYCHSRGKKRAWIFSNPIYIQ